MEPIGTRELPAIHEIDLRIEKIFPLGRGRTIGGYADFFNATNHVVVARVNQNSGSAFGNPTIWTQPRRFRMGVRLMF